MEFQKISVADRVFYSVFLGYFKSELVSTGVDNNPTVLRITNAYWKSIINIPLRTDYTMAKLE